MSESVEQAALRRTRFEERTLAILERCVTAVEALDALDDKREREIAELRDGMLALSNRLEALTKATSQDEFNRRSRFAIDGPR